MKKLTCITTVVCVLAFCGTVLAVRNPNVRNPAGIGTVPPSSLGGGLVTSPNPLDRSGNLTGNLTITGNVRRGMHFRGLTPYDSRTDFRSELGSSSLDSFLRDSAGYEDFGTYSGKYSTQPYFSGSKTVPTMTPGRSGIFKPVDTRISRSPSDVFGLEVLDPRTIQQTQQDEAVNSAIGPAPLTSDELRNLTSGRTRITPENEPPAATLYQRQLELIRKDLMRMKAQEPGVPTPEDTEDAEKKGERDALLRLLTQPGTTTTDRDKEYSQTQKLETPFERAKRMEAQAIEERKQQTSRQDLEAIQKEALQKVLPSYEADREKIKPTDQTKSTRNMADLERLVEQIANLRRKGAGEDLLVGTERIEAPEEVKPNIVETPSITLRNYTDVVLENGQEEMGRPELPPIDEIKSLSNEEVSARARQIMRGQDYESFNKSRFEQFMAEAEAYLKQGKYYRAVNAYDQAAVFNSKDPRTMAGKSLALFAAGEYMSSALFLSRALEISPDYARTKIDLGIAMGDRDKLETRIVDAEEWLERSCAPELEFVIAYMYYCNDRLALAKKAIAAAEKEMPNSKAVKALKEVIDAAKPPSPGKNK